MARVRLRPWRFGRSEKMRLCWLCSPYKTADGSWFVKAAFLRKGSHEPEILEFPWGTLPLLRIGRFYIDGYLIDNDPQFMPRSISINNFRNGTLCKASDIPRDLYDFFGGREFSDDRVWKFWSNRTFYYVPCIELLRAFLTPSKMLANLILKPNGLDFLIVEEEVYENMLYLSLSDDLPRSLVNTATVAHLAWLRYSPAARACWESVYNGLFAKAIAASPQQSASRLTTGIPVELKPPIEKSCELHFNGVTFKQSCLMLELLGVKQLDPLPFKSIFYTHPSLRQHKVVEGAKRKRRTVVKDPNEDYELDPHHRPARINVNQSVADMLATSFEFVRLPKFKRFAAKEAVIHDGSTEEGSSSPSTGTKARMVKRDVTVSTSQSYFGGEIQPVDFLGINLKMANVAGLNNFIEAVQHIVSSYVEPHLRYTVMEIPGNTSFCRVVNGYKRSCAMVEVTQTNVVPCYILEVARPDGWSVSTLFIRLLPEFYQEPPIGVFTKEFLKELVNREGHWNVEKLEGDQTLRIGRLKHVSEQSTRHWSRRIMDKLEAFGFKPKELLPS
jgi:hypothetical protein